MKKFYLGMDIGTESVGMACTDEQYNLLRAKGKDLWAVRLFDEAKDASERRAKRTARRRLERRKQRIDFLQGVFAPFIEDANFFLRLNNSGFYEEDKAKELETRFSLFADADYTDAEFYKDFPTIFHLRKALIEGTEKRMDARHYYLALHHIVKYRGHFLFEGDMGEIRDIRKLFQTYNYFVGELDLEVDLRLQEDRAEDFKALALERKGKNDKKKEGAVLFGATTPEKKEWIALLFGATVSPKKLFGVEHAEKYKEQKSFSFDGLTDENFEAMSESFDGEHFELLNAARAIYNFTVFEKVLGGNENISTAMVALYEKHQRDLKQLKEFVRANYPQETYYAIFRSRKEKNNYVNYIGYNKSKGAKQLHNEKKCAAEEFYKFLVKTLRATDVTDKETLHAILSEIEDKNFLPKILHADNGLFPHQINGIELDCILKALCEKYPVFAQKDEDGYSAAEKIKSIFLFRIPYYVGPLNPSGKNGWMVRKTGRNEKITPWNFDEVVDKAKSNEGFIRRMTNKCTYLHTQDVLPKGSMYYQAFDVLNQINKLRINGEPISISLKQEIFRNVYLKQKKVGAKQIREYLVACGYCTQAESRDILGGFDSMTDLKANMNAYVNFKDRFGSLVDEKPEIFENIILWHTLNTDKRLVEEMILQHYGEISSIKENIKWLKGLTSFKEFGRLSKKLLCEIIGGADSATGEVYTVLNRLYHTNYNFNQLLFADEFSFKEAIDGENAGRTEELSYKDVEELYVSPMVRRGIWQALQMADEYVKAVGKAPDKIFIEVTREHGEKGDQGRKLSRKAKILELYKGLGSDCRELEALTKELNREDMTDSRLRSERLYLYFLQLGKCAYTGNSIKLEQLATDLYDVDHIVPQSMTKDDSLDNKVLVERKKNAEKTNTYPLPQGFTEQQGFWRILKEKGLMSSEKYARLTRMSPLSEEDFRGFVNRQLVVTNQTVKAVAELLKCKYEPFGTKIVYSKAKNVDDFKQRHGIVKCRETNDLHHARDAYLNIIVGNIYDTKFTSNASYFYTDKEGVQRGYNLEKIYRWKIDGAWSGAEDIERVKKIVMRTSMSVTRYSYTNQGAFYDETVYSKEDRAITAPRKNVAPYNQTEKYGGFKSLKTAYFIIVQSKDKKGNLIKTIEAIPVLVDYMARKNKNAIEEFLQTNGLIEPVILVRKLKVKSLVSINGYKVWIAGVASGNRIIIHNARQWFTDSKIDLYIKQLVKLLEKDKNGKLSSAEKLLDKIPLMSNRNEVKLYADKEKNLALYTTIIDKLSQKTYQGLSSVRSFGAKLQEKKLIFEDLTVFEQCKVLLQIIRVMKCNAEKADLTLLNDGANCGSLLIGKNITDIDFSIIHQSPCGLIERIQKI
ncbi:MAG: type II CRISPR RNA-guided endonuclease Cas9 [Clostridia bacterium]|nr:type II CRISPR RNA-guided endonuclease Cas9 [Clostridia bacterium]